MQSRVSVEPLLCQEEDYRDLHLQLIQNVKLADSSKWKRSTNFIRESSCPHTSFSPATACCSPHRALGHQRQLEHGKHPLLSVGKFPLEWFWDASGFKLIGMLGLALKSKSQEFLLSCHLSCQQVDRASFKSGDLFLHVPCIFLLCPEVTCIG